MSDEQRSDDFIRDVPSFMDILVGPGHWEGPTDQAKADELNARASEIEAQAEALQAEVEDLRHEANHYARHWVSTGPGLFDRQDTPFLKTINQGESTKSMTWGLTPTPDDDQESPDPR